MSSICPQEAFGEPKNPYKSRLFSCLIVHARPPFPFTFCFLPPVNAGGTAGTVFPPVGFWDKGLAADGAPLHAVPAENLCFQRLVLRKHRPPKPFTADGIGNALGAGVGVPIVLLQAVAIVIAATLPADQGICPFPLRRGHAVERIVRLALYGRQALVDWIAQVSPPCGIAHR